MPPSRVSDDVREHVAEKIQSALEEHDEKLAKKLKELGIASDSTTNKIYLQKEEPKEKLDKQFWYELSDTHLTPRYPQPWQWDESAKLWLSQVSNLLAYETEMSSPSEFKNISLYFPIPFYGQQTKTAQKKAKIEYLNTSFFFEIQEKSTVGFPDSNAIKIGLNRYDFNSKRVSNTLQASFKKFDDNAKGDIIAYSFEESYKSNERWILQNDRMIALTLNHGFAKVRFMRFAAVLGVRYARVPQPLQEPGAFTLTTKVLPETFANIYS